jgi:hypothetical protein
MPMTNFTVSPVGAQYYTQIYGDDNTVAFEFIGLTASGAVLTPIGSWTEAASFHNVSAYPYGSTTAQSTITADGVYRIEASTISRVGFQVTTAGTGSITVWTRTSQNNLISATPAGSGGGGSTGSVTAGGTNGTQAQAIQGITGGVPVPITGSISATNPSVGTDGATAPTSSTLNGFIGAGGTLSAVTTSAGLPIAGTVSLAGTSAISGTVALSAGAAAIGTVGLSAGSTITLSGSNTVTLAAGASAVGTVALAASSTVTLAAGASNVGTFTDGSFVAQGSTTTGQNGPLGQAAVVAGAAAFTAGTTQPLQMFGSGGLKTALVDGAGATLASAPIGAAGNVTGTRSLALAGVYFATPLAATTGQGVPIAVNTTGAVQVDTENLKASFSVSGTITLAATPTDVFVLPASATKIVRLKRLRIYASATTAGQMTMSLVRRSTANTAGTSANATVVAHNTTLAAATAVPVTYSANPTTLGTSLGAIDTALLSFGVNAAGPIYDEIFGSDNCASLVLVAGGAQNLALNLNGGTVPTGAVLTYRATYTEE